MVALYSQHKHGSLPLHYTMDVERKYSFPAHPKLIDSRSTVPVDHDYFVNLRVLGGFKKNQKKNNESP